VIDIGEVKEFGGTTRDDSSDQGIQDIRGTKRRNNELMKEDLLKVIYYSQL
jgi:hypothetical protein